MAIWADDGDRRHKIDLTVLLDDGAEKSCISEEVAHAIRAPIKQNTEIEIKNATGQRVDVLGEVLVGIKWKAPSGDRVKRIRCYVVRDLQVGMLVSAIIILRLGLRDSSSLLAPMILSARSKAAKLVDEQKSEDIAAANKAREQHEAELRKFERAKLEQDSTAATRTQDGASTHSCESRKPRARVDSLLGGSDTSVTDGSARSTSSLGYNLSIRTASTDRHSSSAGAASRNSRSLSERASS